MYYPEVELVFELFDSISGVDIVFSFITPRIQKRAQVSETYLATSKTGAPVTNDMFNLELLGTKGAPLPACLKRHPCVSV